MKKIIALMIIAQILLCMVNIPMGVMAAQEVNQYHVNTLVALDVVDEYIDYDKSVSRGEFTELILKLLGSSYDGIAEEQIYFKDVSSQHKYFKPITVAAQLGLVEGHDSRFNPDSGVTLSEAITILVRGLGYGKVIDVTNALSIASSLELLDGVVSNGNEKINNATLIRLFFNALMTDIAVTDYSDMSIDVNSDVTLLESIYDGREVKGIVTANRHTTLMSASTNLEGYIEIDGVYFEAGKTDISSYLGYDIKGIVIESMDVETFISFELSNKNKTIVVESDDILSDTTTTVFKYTAETKIESESIRGCDIIYNGQFCGSYTDADLIPASGNVTLLDNNSDGEIDVVFVESYVINRVASVNATTETIADYYGQQPVKVNENTYVYSSEGYGIDYLTLKKDDIVSVYRSKSSDPIIKLVVSAHVPVEGRITSTRTTNGRLECEIGAEFYELNRNYETLMNNHSNKTPQLAVGFDGIFYLDADGRIAAAKFKSNSEMYGFLCKLIVIAEPDETMIYKIYTEDGQFIEGEQSKRIKINNSRTEIADIDDNSILFPNAKFEPQLIKFTLDSEGLITEIKCASKSQITNITEDQTALEYNGETSEVYQSQIRGLTKRGSVPAKIGNFILDAETIIFNIPSDLKDEDGFSILTSKDMKVDTRYLMEMYDADRSYTVDVAVSRDVQTTNYAHTVLSMSIVTGKVEMYDDAEGEVYKCLEVVEKGVEKILKPAQKDLFDNVRRGDFIFALYNSEGEVTSYKTFYTQNATKPVGENYSLNSVEYGRKWIENHTQTTGDEYANMIIHGKILDYSENAVAIIHDLSEPLTSICSYYTTADTKVYYVDVSSDLSRICITASDINSLRPTNSDTQPNGSDVIVYQYRCGVREIFILD